MSDIEDEEAPSDEEQGLEEQQESVNFPLTRETATNGLSVLSKIPGSIEHVYVRLDIREKNLSDIVEISGYKHLRFVDISNNHIVDLSPLNFCEALCTLNASQNQLSNCSLNRHQYLQQLDLSQNKLAAIPTLDQPMLKVLKLASNSIQNTDELVVETLPALESLILDHNQLEAVTLPVCKTLKFLSASNNKIANVIGLDVLPNLEGIVLRDNLISSLDGLPQDNATILAVDLSANQIGTLDEAKKVGTLHKLRTLFFADNVVAEESAYRQEMLVSCPDLVAVDDIECEAEEKADAAALRRQRTAVVTE
eukprot:m.249050 g.249050  ORF g.249050 m.249050 type:complete len:309 (+) comp19512_c0_seq1:224-1150(+)